MRSAIIIGPTNWLVHDLRERCAERDDLYIYKVLFRYPSPFELYQMVGVLSPDILFLEVTHSQEELAILREVQTCYPTVAIVGFGEPQDQAALRGVSQYLAAPLKEEALEQAISAAIEFQKAAVPDNIVAFLPAKAGSGSTTLALHVAGYLVHSCKLRVLFIEADVNSGPVSLLLNLEADQTIINALENCQWLDDKNWPTLVTNAAGLHVLPAPRSAQVPRMLQWNCRRLLTFVRTRYDMIVVDLPEVVNDATEAIVTEAQKVYVVCTPEKPSVLLARRRMYAMEARGVKESQIAVVLNRHTKMDPTIEEVEEALGRQVSYVLPNDYRAVRQAMQGARLIEQHSRLGPALFTLARIVAGLPLEDEKRGLLFFRRKSAKVSRPTGP